MSKFIYLRHWNQTNRYLFGLVDRFVLSLTSNVHTRGRYINAIIVPVCFEDIRLFYFKISLFFKRINVCSYVGFILVFHKSKCVYHHKLPDTRWCCTLPTNDHGLWLWTCCLFGSSLQYGMCKTLIIYCCLCCNHLHVTISLGFYNKQFATRFEKYYFKIVVTG